MNIKVKYHDKNMPRLQKFDKGNWIDLRAIEGGTVVSEKDGIKRKARWYTKVKNIDGEEYKVKTFKYKKGDFIMLSLGVTIAAPDGYEVHILPRSSTFSKYGLIMVNSEGIGDNSFRGNNDVYHMPCYALRDGEIELYDRVCQFRLERIMEELIVEEVEDTRYDDRGGFGTTGNK